MLSKKAKLKVAQGRVWTGRQAMERGLVDSSGGLFAALDLVTRLTKAGSANAEVINALHANTYW